MRTANPALNDTTFSRFDRADASRAMTIQGTVNKTILLLGILLFPACWVWNQYFSGAQVGQMQMWIAAGAIGGLIIAIVTVFKKQWAGVTAPIYAALEGLAIGGLSAIFESMFPGIVIQAAALTFGVLFSLLLAYKSGFIKATENFKLGVVAATGAVCLLYLASFILGFFGISIPFIHDSGPIGIGVSAVIVIIAALNLVLDFDFIEQGASQQAPKFMEWYAAFGLMVTLIWLYMEILRLLSKLRSR